MVGNLKGKSDNTITFEYYFQTYYQQALGYVLKHVGSVQTAEDLTMNAFLTCYQHFDDFDPEKASFATWLYVNIRNKLKNHYRDRKETEELDENICVEFSFADELAEASQLHYLRKHLADALRELGETQRKIVVYKYFCDKTSNEIADIIGTTPGNVRVQLKRTLQKLEEYFKKNDIRWE